MSIPAIVNLRAGAADALREAIAADPRFALVEAEPQHVADAVTAALRDGASRVAVGGGDGTVAAAAAAMMASPAAELAVLPGGTLNHFALHLGVPAEPRAALDVAARGEVRLVDVAFVGERLFLNTSSGGAYVAFVRMRERLERHMPYLPASILAGLALFFNLPSYRVELEIDGAARRYHTPLVFVGLGERETKGPEFGRWAREGRPGLHVIVVRGRRRARMLALGLAAAAGGPRAVARFPDVDSFLVERLSVSVAGTTALLATDGEVKPMRVPLEFRVERARLRVVAEPPAADR